jgi:hypothetical protein
MGAGITDDSACGGISSCWVKIGTNSYGTDEYVLASGFAYDDLSSIVVSSDPATSWALGSGPVFPDIPGSQYGMALLQAIWGYVSSVLPYAGAMTGLLIIATIGRNWIGRRKASQI